SYSSIACADINYIIYTESMRNWNSDFLPITIYVNTALDSSQVPKAFQQKNFFQNHRRVFNEIINPVKYVNQDGGFLKWFYTEFATPSAISGFTLHLLGGGYDFRYVAEWYQYNGVPMPYLFAFVTTYLGCIGNKAIEASNKYITSHHDLSSLLVYDIVGKLIFLDDTVTRFMFNEMGLRNWAGQPMLNVRTLTVMNTGNYYILRPYFFNKYVRPFVLMGMQYLAGLSFNLDDKYSLTLSSGVATTGPFNVDH